MNDAEEFLRRGYEEGKVVSHKELHELFGLPYTPKEAMITRGELDSRMFAYVSRVERLRADLQKLGHDLQNRTSQGYYLVPFQERVTSAHKDGTRETRRALSKWGSRLNSIHHPEQLIGSEKRLLDHDKITIGHLRSIMGCKRKYE